MATTPRLRGDRLVVVFAGVAIAEGQDCSIKCASSFLRSRVWGQGSVTKQPDESDWTVTVKKLHRVLAAGDMAQLIALASRTTGAVLPGRLVVTNNGVRIFEADAWVTDAVLTLPMGLSEEEVTFEVTDDPIYVLGG